MAEYALGLAMFVLGAEFCLPRCLHALGLPAIPFVEMVCCLPAVLLGMLPWLRRRSVASGWIVLLCLLVVWMGLLHAEREYGKRALFSAVQMSIGLPLAALVIRKRAWRLAATAFIAGATSAALLVAVLQLGMEGGWRRLSSIRLGNYVVNGASLTNPNGVGVVLAAACVLAFILHLRGRAAGRPALAAQAEIARQPFGLGWTILPALACLLTVSRGAIVALAAAMLYLVIRGTRTQHASRVKDFLVMGLLAGAVVFLAGEAGSVSPWDGLKARVFQEGSLDSIGGRTSIWRNALLAIRSEPKYMLWGNGTGMASLLLGRFDPQAVYDQYGKLNRSCHNTYFDWLLSFGLTGVAALLCLAFALGRRAVELDHREGVADRKALLLLVALVAITGVIYQHNAWPAISALTLAMLNDRSLPRAAAAVAADRGTVPDRRARRALSVPGGAGALASDVPGHSMSLAVASQRQAPAPASFCRQDQNDREWQSPGATVAASAKGPSEPALPAEPTVAALWARGKEIELMRNAS